MNSFEEMHKKNTHNYKKYKLIEVIANELNNYFEIHQGYEDKDQDSVFDLLSIYELSVKKEKFNSNEQQVIIESAIKLAGIKYNITIKQDL